MAKLNVGPFPMHPEAKHEKMREYSDGIRIGGGLKLRPAPYLPIIEIDKNLDKGIVMKKGTFVTLDQFGYVVPARKTDAVLTYGQYDVDYGTYNIDDFGAGNGKVSSTGTSTKTLGPSGDIKTGKPIGVLMFDVYAWDMGNDPWYQVQDPITILADRMILLAVPASHASVSYEPGDILVIDDSGFVSPFNPVFDGEDLAATQTQIANPGLFFQFP